MPKSGGGGGTFIAALPLLTFPPRFPVFSKNQICFFSFSFSKKVFFPFRFSQKKPLKKPFFVGWISRQHNICEYL